MQLPYVGLTICRTCGDIAESGNAQSVPWRARSYATREATASRKLVQTACLLSGKVDAFFSIQDKRRGRQAAGCRRLPSGPQGFPRRRLRALVTDIISSKAARSSARSTRPPGTSGRCRDSESGRRLRSNPASERALGLARIRFQLTFARAIKSFTACKKSLARTARSSAYAQVV